MENPTKLKEVLEENTDERFRLSEKACIGILNRAEKRKKKLPFQLERALRAQAKIGRDGNPPTIGPNDPRLPREGGSFGERLDRTCGIDQQGGKGGANYTVDIAPTLASDSPGTPHAVAYGISAFESNAMKSKNPYSGVYLADTSRTLDLNGGSPACNQGGMIILNREEVKTFSIEGNGTRKSHYGNGYSETDIMYTLNTIEQHAVAAVDCRNCTEDPDINGTLQAKANGGSSVNLNNVVRVGVDVYNQTIEGDIAPTLTAACGGTNTSGPKVMVFAPQSEDKLKAEDGHGDEE